MWNKWVCLNTFCGHLSSCYQVYVLSGLPDDPEWAERLCGTTRGHRWKSHHSYHLWADTLHPGAESREEIGKKSPFLCIAHLDMNCTLPDHAHWRLKTILWLDYAEIIDITWSEPNQPIPGQPVAARCFQKKMCTFFYPHSQKSNQQMQLLEEMQICHWWLSLLCTTHPGIKLRICYDVAHNCMPPHPIHPGLELGQVSRSMDWEQVDTSAPTHP